ncbi:MAG: DivIVA domain-containing protein [Schwartzia sp.]|nr:DivIVA domain-containing protein [Schwartzia sp. (in: firmicutes)]
MLTPADIHNKEFSRGFRGYSEEEVDDFLDEVIESVEEMTKRIAKLEDELSLERKKVSQYQEMESKLKETLDVAQKTADDVVESAKVRIEEMERAAKEDRDRLRHQTEMAIQRRMEDATAKVREQQELYEAGVARERQFMVRLRSLLRSELAILNADGLAEIIGTADEDKEAAAEAKENAAVSEQETLVLNNNSWNNRFEEERVETDARVLAQQREADRLKRE